MRIVKARANKPAIGWRIFFFIIALIFGVYTIDNLIIGIVGEHAVTTSKKLSFSKHEVNGNGKDYQWTIDYQFKVDGEVYSGFTVWHGSRDNPDSGYGKYHVNYMPGYPKINRFSRYNSIVKARDAEDIVLGGGITLLTTFVGLVATMFFLFLAGVPVPIPWIKRRK